MDHIFGLADLFALSGWLVILAALWVKPFRRFAFIYSGLLVPALLAAVYVYLLLTTKDAHGGFDTLANVKALFSNEQVLTAGWIHYLAFDVFVGTWIARDGMKRGVWRLALMPVLLLTFMLGPAGFLGYLALRTLPVFKKKAGLQA